MIFLRLASLMMVAMFVSAANEVTFTITNWCRYTVHVDYLAPAAAWSCPVRLSICTPLPALAARFG